MKTPLLMTLPALFLSACAGLGGPSADEISRLPVVRFGQPAPAGEFVLLYPAGVNLPVIAKVDGSLLAKTDQTQLNIQVKQDVFVYRDQVSFDGKIWHLGTEKIVGKFMFSLPGEKNGKRDATSPGEMGAEFNLR